MSVATATARRWTCDGCAVSVSWIDGHQAPLPENWSSSAEGCLCLKCRREEAAESALATVPGDSNRDVRAKLRRAGLIEFEVRRTPDRPDSTIARACRASSTAVAAARQRIKSQDAVGGARRG
jgi:hypothetical protein